VYCKLLKLIVVDNDTWRYN